MISTRKTAGPVLLFIFALAFIPPICAEPLPGEEPAPGGEVSSEETSIAVDPLLLDEDDLFDDEAFFFEAAGLVYEVSPIIDPRSFIDIFPNLSQFQKSMATSAMGLRFSFEKEGSQTLFPGPDSGIDLLSSVMKKKPSHIIEALIVVPYIKRELDLLDVYNALGEIKNIKNHKITINDKEYVIFKDTTRLDNAKNRKPIPDPPPQKILPYSETMYLLFLDPYIGDLYLKGDISVSLYGLTYSMTNFRDISYSIFRVMKADRFSAIIYVEPVKEGILIYSVSGLYLPNFIAKRIDLTPNMNRRITVLIKWITEGLRNQEDSRQDKHFYRLKPKVN